MKSSQVDIPISQRRRRRRPLASVSSAVSTTTMFLCSTLSLTSITALISPSISAFLSPQVKHLHNDNRINEDCLSSTGVSLLQRRGSHDMSKSISRIKLSMINSESNEDDNEEEEENEVKRSLDKIKWLPNISKGKQPYKPAIISKKSRTESKNGEGYEAIESNIMNEYQNIEVLPVLPMPMVHGLEGINLDGGVDDDEDTPYYLTEQEEESILQNGYSYGAGVWEEDVMSSSSSLGQLFSGTSSYLPHTKNHVFTVAELRYKKLYDDLLRMGNYYGRKRAGSVRRLEEKEAEMRYMKDGGAEGGDQVTNASSSSSVTTSSSSSQMTVDPDEKRRFIVTAQNPAEPGSFAEYGLLFQLKDLDEVAAVAELGGEDGFMSMEELLELIESNRDVSSSDDLLSGQNKDFMDILLQTHYEATHDVVGRVKIHRFVNPECFNDGPNGDEYLMAEASILEVIEDDRTKMLQERKKRRRASTTTTATSEEEEVVKDEESQSAELKASIEEQVNDAVGKAVERIKDELRSSVGEAFRKQSSQLDSDGLDSDEIKEKLRQMANKSTYDVADMASSRMSSIPLVPKGIYVERRSDESLSKEERALRESFAKLVSLQHELKEECRFTRVSVQTFGVGAVGVWLSASAWSQFVSKRLEATHSDMQADLQRKLVEYLSEKGSSSGTDGPLYLGEVSETIDFDELTEDLQEEFQLVQGRSMEELGPLALEKAIIMQRIVQAESYTERINLLRECVDGERRRLQAKKMLGSLSLDGVDGRRADREEARSLFEKLVSTSDDGTDINNEQQRNQAEDDAFQ